jgi:hypothetical protein
MAALDNGGAGQAGVDPGFKALRATIRPMETLAWLSFGAASGALTIVAAGGAVFSLRNLSANPIIIRRLGIGFVTTTGFTAGQELRWGLNFQRAFTASDTSGTAIAFTGNNAKHRTSLGTPTSLDARISAAAALTAGTKTADANDLSIAGGYAPTTTVGVVIAPGLSNLLSHDTGDYPLVLAQNEGINIFNRISMGAGGIGSLYVNGEIAEVAAF